MFESIVPDELKDIETDLLTLDDFYSDITALESFANEIIENGVNQSLILGIESIDPDFLPDDVTVKHFTINPSPVFVDIAMESAITTIFKVIGKSIELIFKLFGKLLSGVVKVIEWMVGGSDKNDAVYTGCATIVKEGNTDSKEVAFASSDVDVLLTAAADGKLNTNLYKNFYATVLGKEPEYDKKFDALVTAKSTVFDPVDNALTHWTQDINPMLLLRLNNYHEWCQELIRGNRSLLKLIDVCKKDLLDMRKKENILDAIKQTDPDVFDNETYSNVKKGPAKSQSEMSEITFKTETVFNTVVDFAPKYKLEPVKLNFDQALARIKEPSGQGESVKSGLAIAYENVKLIVADWKANDFSNALPSIESIARYVGEYSEETVARLEGDLNQTKELERFYAKNQHMPSGVIGISKNKQEINPSIRKAYNAYVMRYTKVMRSMGSIMVSYINLLSHAFQTDLTAGKATNGVYDELTKLYKNGRQSDG